jgi:hypothetical protein
MDEYKLGNIKNEYGNMTLTRAHDTAVGALVLDRELPPRHSKVESITWKGIVRATRAWHSKD